MCEAIVRPFHDMLLFSNSSFFCIGACNTLEIELLSTSYIFNTFISIKLQRMYKWLLDLRDLSNVQMN